VGKEPRSVGEALAAPGSSCARIDAARTALAAYAAILKTGIEP
jgi:hypothetical protein